MPISRREILQALATKSYDIPLFSRPQLSKQPILDVDIPALSLSSAVAHFQAKLLSSGILPQVCDATLLRASQLADVYQESYIKSCRHLMNSPHPSNGPPVIEAINDLRRTLEYVYEHSELEEFFSRAFRSKIIFGQKLHAARNQRERTPLFNQGFTPYLEAYFQKNAFPSAADRKSLAQTGKMSPRQIEVWFQNHRNRAKKYGQSLKRLAAGTAVNISSDLLTVSAPSFAGNHSLGDNTLDDSSSDEEDTNNEDELQTPQLTAFDSPAPRNETPENHVPRLVQPCTTDCKAFGLPPPSWTRRTTVSRTKPSTSVSELIEMFSAKLNLREGASRKTPKRSQSPVLESWISATTTVPCPAPHPAMIRRLSSFFTGMSSPRHRTPPTTLIPTKVPSLPSVLPTWELSPPPRRRKPAQLPRRSPPYARPCASQSASQHSTLSRTSSISSISSSSSSDSRLTSSSSSTSTFSTSTSEFTAESSPELTTPPVSPTPDGTQTFEADQDDDIFGDRYYESYSRTQDVYDEQAFNKDVSQSIPQFEAMDLPEFQYFES